MKRLVWLLFVVVLLVPGGAGAQTDDSTERARQHFSLGVKLYDAKPPDYERALGEFRAAYAEKPSPGIKRNVALCLRGLGRYSQAMDALDEMLAEGDSLKPEVRAAAQKALAEMSAQVATLRIAVRASDSKARPAVEVWLDDARLADNKLARPVRVMPGEHSLRAAAPAFKEAARKVVVRAGEQDVPVDLELTAAAATGLGRLVVHSSSPTAQIAVDGVMLPGRGDYAGPAGVGTHTVVVTERGYQTFEADVSIAANETKDVEATLVMVGSPDLPAAKPKPEVERSWYLSAGLALMTEKLTLSGRVFATDGDIDRGFGGASVVAKLGRKLGRFFAIEAVGEVGAYSKPQSYTAPQNFSIVEWALAPELRFHTVGRARFVAGVAAGVEGESTNATLNGVTDARLGCRTPMTGEQGSNRCSFAASGAGTSVFGLLDAGIQFQVHRTFFEAAPFIDLHGVPDSRLYTNSIDIRGGIRLLVGYDL